MVFMIISAMSRHVKKNSVFFVLYFCSSIASIHFCDFWRWNLSSWLKVSSYEAIPQISQKDFCIIRSFDFEIKMISSANENQAVIWVVSRNWQFACAGRNHKILLDSWMQLFIQRHLKIYSQHNRKDYVFLEYKFMWNLSLFEFECRALCQLSEKNRGRLESILRSHRSNDRHSVKEETFLCCGNRKTQSPWSEYLFSPALWHVQKGASWSGLREEPHWLPLVLFLKKICDTDSKNFVALVYQIFNDFVAFMHSSGLKRFVAPIEINISKNFFSFSSQKKAGVAKIENLSIAERDVMYRTTHPK